MSSAIALAQYLGLSTSLSPWINTTPIGEAFGNLRQRNQFASLTNIALAALLWWSARPRPKQFEKAVRSSLMVAAVLLGIGNAVSSSRTGLFQSILLLAMAWFWGGLRNPAALRAAIGFVLAYALALLVLPFMVGLSPWSSGAWARLQAGDAVCSSRLTLWHNVLTLIAQQPWRGWGWGELDYAHYITLYDSPRFCDILDNAHNLPLHLAVELGVPVSLLFCGLVIAWVWRSRPWSETDPTRQMAWSVLAVIGLHSLLEYPLWYGPFQIATGLCVILLWRKPVTVLIKNRALAQAGYALVAIILGAACLYAAWDYHRISQIYLSVDARDPDYRVDTLEKIRSSFLFQDQVRFAELSVTPLTLNNAESQYQLALDLLHFSPEHRVIERVIDSALLLGHDDVAVFHLLRLKAAFPDAYAEWMAAHKPPKTLLKTAP
ncbi:PglL family O-oligosaccharyltransferase [Rhodoferax sp.]|uniref:PglL family O-oligosaccharyltransferase n=1 Tax=Rhodoferax sp. TaxID=50421 RepID=UPI00374D15CE